ncbi:MAG: hemerythrin domain-containing protein [Phycisphaerae bacterium]|nr:hemerythrin domain-containing protein [Phycisphaerae bacterium]
MFNLLGGHHAHDFDEPIGLLTDCHRRIEKFLEILHRVACAYGEKPLDQQAAAAVRTAQHYFTHAAPRHTADEEESLFPRMKAAAASQGQGCDALVLLHRDHDRADRLHAQVDMLLMMWLSPEAGGSLPPDRLAELTTLLDTLRDLYRDHIHVEEAEVFPLAGKLLSAHEFIAVGEEMRARRGLTPPG